MISRRWWIAVLAGFLSLAHATLMEAQWVMVGRAAANRVRHMTQKSGASGYDVATILLEAPSNRVYDGAVKALQAHPDIAVTKQDREGGKLEFRKGGLVAGLQITALSENLTQLVIASSAADDTQPSAVVDGVLSICKEMKVECKVQQD